MTERRSSLLSSSSTCELVQAQLVHSYHAIVHDSCALDEVDGAPRAKYLTLTNWLLQDAEQVGRSVRADRISDNILDNSHCPPNNLVTILYHQHHNIHKTNSMKRHAFTTDPLLAFETKPDCCKLVVAQMLLTSYGIGKLGNDDHDKLAVLGVVQVQHT
jgi:hypothetical protein